VEELAPSETEKETAYEIRAMDIGALTTLGTLAPASRKSGMMVIDLDRLVPCQGAARDERPQGLNNGEEGETKHRRRKHSPQKKKKK
jgi:hypothetical protein